MNNKVLASVSILNLCKANSSITSSKVVWDTILSHGDMLNKISLKKLCVLASLVKQGITIAQAKKPVVSLEESYHNLSICREGINPKEIQCHSQAQITPKHQVSIRLHLPTLNSVFTVHFDSCSVCFLYMLWRIRQGFV